MENFNKVHLQNTPRTELHDLLSLAGAGISVNTLLAGTSVPFVHAHKCNEKIYGILHGKRKSIIGEKEIALTKDDWVRISPEAKQQLFTTTNVPLTYLCIQVKKNSLKGFTKYDAIIY